MYLLLRNNKQSGPYSLDDLKSMGLKAYDLVWLEGKSAAWRYPCEIDELKSFAPPVEEQPFDRFYKRTSTTNTVAAEAAATTTATLTVKPATESPIPVTVDSTKPPGKRIIYVTMPAARSASSPAVLREPVREPVSPVRESIQPNRETLREPAYETRGTTRVSVPEPSHAAYNGIGVVKDPSSEDYSSQSPDENIATVEFLPRRKPRQTARIVRLLAVGSCILALLAAGIFIGLNLNKENLGFPSRVVAKLPSANTDQSIVHPTTQTLPAPAQTTPAVSGPDKPVDTVATIVEQPAVTLPTVNKTTPRTPGNKTSKDKPAHPMSQANASSLKDSAAGGFAHRDAIHRADVIETNHDNTEATEREAAVKTALASQVSVGANGYVVGTFGGITDLQLTVTNRSVYPLDLVIVEVQYIQANKKVYKTENLYFHGVGAGAAVMQAAPKSSRGVRVQYRITSISSKDGGLTYSGI